MSLCDRCREPGHCCKAFNLTNENGSLTWWDDEPPALDDKFPFTPMHRIGQWTVEYGPETGRTYSAWRWACTKLGSDGRCTIYEDRPQLCRDYRAESDPLCVEHEPGKFRGIPIVLEAAPA